MAAPGTAFDSTSAVAEMPENVSQTLVAATAADPGYSNSISLPCGPIFA